MTERDHLITRDLLLEIGVEDLPSRFLAGALADLASDAKRRLGEFELTHGTISTLGTPRRLTLHVAELTEEQPTRSEVKTGPPLHVAYDGDGKPTKAALAFAAKFNCTEAELQIAETTKGQRVQLEVTLGGAATTELLPGFIEELITGLPLPKSMRWGASELRFLRPIRWLAALYGEESIEIELAGVRSGKTSRGHRFLSAKPFELPDADLDTYRAACRDHYVVVDDTQLDEEGRVTAPGERYELLRGQVELELKELGATGYDVELLLTVTNMVEHPTCLVGGFEERFLELPDAVVVSTLREYQKYFEVRDGEGGLLPRFIAVRDGGERNAAGVIAGHERVLRARLTDAGYFWEESVKRPLDDLTAELDGLRFIRGLGSYADKRRRLIALTAFVDIDGVCDSIAPICEEVTRAAELAKQDLLTPLVVEFTSLQGVIGGELARRHGESEGVARAVAEQYLPVGFSGRAGELPQSAVGCLLSLLDKLDTLAGCFATGLEPTGSADPFGLRRAARGVLGVAMGVEGHDVAGLDRSRLSLTPLIAAAVDNYSGETKKDFEPADVEERLAVFLSERAERLFIELGVAGDAARAALETYNTRPWAAWRCARALSEAKDGPDFANLAAGYKRAANILKQAAKELELTDFAEPESALFDERAEIELAAALRELRSEEVFEAAVERGAFSEAIARAAELRPVIDTFFDTVMVLTDDDNRRNNRLALLSELVELFGRLGDLSRITPAG